jgi:carboxylate-amine ligase
MVSRMPIKDPSFTFGIEEEYLLVERQTRDLARDPPKSLLAECEALLKSQVSPEFLRSQIEVGTRICRSASEAREELRRLRKSIAGVCQRHGLAPVAASTHPFADWTAQRHTDKERYNDLAHDLQVIGRRLVICGMHVHIGIEDDDVRIDLMNQLRYFLPHLLVLSTSSPFWLGHKTGLKSYRLAIQHESPRTGMPGVFGSWHEYQGTVDVLVRADVIQDASKIWWDIRPSTHFKTLEMRITDVCTNLEDAVTIAALYRCICRMLYRLRRDNQRWRQYPLFLLNENRWRAQRYGRDQGLFDFGKGEIVPLGALMDELIELVRPDAEHFDCVTEIERVRTIIAEGTSADRQLARYDAAVAGGAGPRAALDAVVDGLIAETLAGT